MKILNLIENKLIIEKNLKYVAIIGLNASTTARSPKLWNYVYKKMNTKIKMYPFDVEGKNLKKLLRYLEKDKNFLGCSIAVPYKEQAFKILNNNIDKSSIGIGSINCIYRDKNFKLRGLNSDGIASLEVFEKKFGKIKSNKVAVIGYGGVGKSVAANFIKNNEVFVFSRKKNDELSCKKMKMNWYNFSDLNKRIKDINIIINCTSIGFNTMKNKSPVNLNTLKKLDKKTIIYDVIYNPKRTKLLLDSKKQNLKTLNGSAMNIYQALIAFKYVNNIKNKKSLLKIEYLMKSAAK